MLWEICRTLCMASLAGTVLAAVLVLLRPVTKRVFGPNWHYYIWVAVLLVMVLPVRVFLPAGELDLRPPQVFVAEQAELPAEGMAVQSPADGTVQQADGQSTGAFARPAAVWLAGHWQQLLGLLWLAGAVGMLLMRTVGYMRFLHKIRLRTATVSCQVIAAYTHRTVEVRAGNMVHSPFVTGLFRPVLVLPAAAMTDEQLDNVLRHEMTHLRRHDLLVQWFAALVKCVHWFNPAVYAIVRQMGIECEISCDLSVIRHMDGFQQRSYAETILALLPTEKTKAVALTTGMTGSKKILKRRFMMMKQNKAIGKWASALSAALAVVLFATTVLAGGILSSLTADQYTITVTNHGRELELSHKPFILDGAVYLPLREVLEDSGVFDHPRSSLTWDNGNMVLTAVYAGSEAEVANHNAQNTEQTDAIDFVIPLGLAIGRNTVELGPDNQGGQVWEFALPPVLRESTTYVPYDYLSLLADLSLLEWNVQYRVYDRAGNELARGLPENNGPLDTAISFFGAFWQREFDAMKEYCTDACVEGFFGDGFVFGMTQAMLYDYTIDPMEYAKSSNDFVINVTVDMVLHPGSVYAPDQTRASFYLILLRQPDGRYLIDEFATGL